MDEVCRLASSEGHMVLWWEWTLSLCLRGLLSLLQAQTSVCSVRTTQKNFSNKSEGGKVEKHNLTQPLAYMRATAGWWKHPQSHQSLWSVWLRYCAWSGLLRAGCWRCRLLCPEPERRGWNYLKKDIYINKQNQIYIHFLKILQHFLFIVISK